MEKSASHLSRREFMAGSAALAAVGATLPMQADIEQIASPGARDEFAIYQERRRWELWSLLGDLPWDDKPAPPRLVRTEKHEGYTLERLIFDFNGSNRFQRCCLFRTAGRRGRPDCCLSIGTRASTTWGKNNCCAAHRCNRHTRRSARKKAWRHSPLIAGASANEAEGVGRQGEEDTFKLMLWRGQVLWGMMMFDELRALSYLAGRPEVDPARLGAFGMSTGATKARWLAGSIRASAPPWMFVLTDYESLIEANGLSKHGVYYFVPALLKDFDTFQINELIVPRAHLSMNGRQGRPHPASGRRAGPR